MGSVTGGISGGLGQVFSASGFWGSVGSSAFAGAGTGGVTALLTGQNFLEGVLKGAVIGGVVTALGQGINQLFNRPNGNQIVSEVKREDIFSPTVSSPEDTQKYSYGTMKEFEKGYGSLRKYGVEYYYLKNPSGYGIAKDGSFYRLSFWNKIGLGSVPETSNVLGVTLGNDIYISKAAFASKGLLTEVVTHETGHVILGNSNLSVLASSFFEGKGRFAKFFDDLGHISIRKMSLKLFDTNTWLQKSDWMQVIKSWEIPESNPLLDKLLIPLIKPFKY
ncbi:hypothetical protein LF887_01435 [Chryseobacterium sp. MEBOG06]|uniref:hypothetical protein n=1 Tax=Chryseobacterium sp. MEBOG06 TaxID=2879938 RepID=UPI001F404E6C|nr:hypothetical protein [Chryseobacterium sp. MEBOG06]UKB84344.1 hypothetical protein LF887_01435 [Chryseobacterium sp. MEBOG06]